MHIPMEQKNVNNLDCKITIGSHKIENGGPYWT